LFKMGAVFQTSPLIKPYGLHIDDLQAIFH